MVIIVAMRLILLEISHQDCSLFVLDGVHRSLHKYHLSFTATLYITQILCAAHASDHHVHLLVKHIHDKLPPVT